MDTLVLRGQLTQSLGSALHRGGHALRDVPTLVMRALETEAWRERTVIETGERIPGFPTFAAYVCESQPKGLGADMGLIERMVSNDPETLKLFRDAMKNQGARTDLNADNFHDIVMEVEQGNDKAYALGRLSRERPDLFEDVKAGKLTAHRAMVQAGFRHPTASVPLDDMARLARTLRKHLSPDQVLALRDLLAGS